MSSEVWAQIIAGLVGVGFTVLFRIVDRWLPDPDKQHPLPPAPDVKPEETSP